MATLLALVMLGRPARANGGPATDAYAGMADGSVDVHGVADVYLQGNLRAPVAGMARYRAYDVRANEPSIGTARLTLAHKPERVGFRLDVGVGDLADGYLRFDPAATAHPQLSRALSYVEQAFVTVVVPVGNGIELDVGKFGTPVGLEDNEALPNWSYSRSLLFLLAEPSYHCGLRATYQASKDVAATFFWLNGWDTNVLDGNTMRTLAGAVSWTPAPRLVVSATYMAGPERAITLPADPALKLRGVLDLFAQYDLTDRLSLASTGDYGHDGADGGVSWWGIGGYVHATMPKGISATVRAEHYGDPDAFTSGTKQRLAEVTATLELRGQLGRASFIERLEYRRDQSDALVFASGLLGRSSRQDTATVALLAAF